MMNYENKKSEPLILKVINMMDCEKKEIIENQKNHIKISGSDNNNMK